MTNESHLTLARTPRWAAATLGAAVLATLIPLASPASAVPDSYDGEIEVSSGDGLIPSVRFAGDDRFETAGLIATDDTDFAADFDGDDVVLTRADIFPDALAGSRIGGVYEAPILLTPTDTEADGGELNDDLAAALDEIDPEVVHVLGSDAAVSESLTALIASEYGASINRIGGVNRFETAALIADQQFDDPPVTTETQTVIVSNGGDANLVDALVSGAIGAASDTPILLTGGGGPLDPFTADRLQQLSAESVTVYVAGGPESLPDDIVDQIEDITGDGSAVRIDGERAESLQPGTSTNTRFATAVAFAELGTDVFDFGSDHANLARGDVFADALALGPHAGLDTGGPAPIVLSANDALSQETEDYFTTLRDCRFESLHLAGGTEALSAQVNTEARTALSGASGEACDLTLTPETATNLVGESHTVTATLVDNTGETATALDDGYEVDFTTTTESGTAMAEPETATAEVGEDGTADFTFTSLFPGTIRIYATFTNAEGETRTATATKEYVLPDLSQEIPNDLTVQLSSAQEVPPTVPDPGATGVADLELYPMLGIVCAQITVDKGTATGTFAGSPGAHIHEAPAGVAGPIVVALPRPSDDTGTVDSCAAVDGALQSEILGDRTNYYVNVHTTDYPAGLVRGQLS